MKDLSYTDQIKLKISQARKERIAAKVIYYSEALYMSACVSYERFKGSFAWESWLAKRMSEINQMNNERARLGFGADYYRVC